MKYITINQSNLFKKTAIIFIAFFGIFLSCGETNHNNEDSIYEAIEVMDNEAVEETEIVEETVMDPRSFGGEKAEEQLFIDELSDIDISNDNLGSFVGTFGNNMINIALYKVEKGIAEGYSVCAGNFRKIEGTYTVSDDGFLEFKMDEPGDDKYDGTFVFTKEGNDLRGKWTPFKTAGTSAKSYVLTKRTYLFNQNNGDYPEASTRLLTDEDVENLHSDELGYMRNCIYARHGYSFKDKLYRGIFEDKDWYMPTCIDVRDKLSDIEVANIELIYEYEDYYEMYYDDYGR